MAHKKKASPMASPSVLRVFGQLAKVQPLRRFVLWSARAKKVRKVTDFGNGSGQDSTMKNHLGQYYEIIAYGLASLAALAVDLCLLYALHQLWGLPLWLAAAIGFGAGIIVIYQISIRSVFCYRRLAEKKHQEFGWFLLTGLIGLGFTVLAVPLLSDGLGWPLYLAKGVCVGFVFTFNFIARKMVLFTKKVSTT